MADAGPRTSPRWFAPSPWSESRSAAPERQQMAGGWAPTNSSSSSGLGAEKAPSGMEATSPKPTASTSVRGSPPPQSLAGPTKRAGKL
eukprot:5914702-Pyramimonas_sp.AAC.1